MKTALLFLITLFPLPASADMEIRGRVFYDKISRDVPAFLFLSRVKEEPGNKRTITCTYQDKNGKDLASEESVTEGFRLIRYSYKQLQVQEHGEATFGKDNLEMRFTEDGETETDTEKPDSNPITSTMITLFLNEKWNELMSGETVKARYVVVERLETIGFKFFKDGERSLRGKDVVDIIMKPSSVFISALVNPIKITMTKTAPHWIVETVGRTPIRWPTHNPPRGRSDWKAIDAKVEYDPPKDIGPATTK